jgi:ABC-type methionine transport system ATPase subunit
MIFQFFNLLDDLTVADNVLLPAQLAGRSRRKARARVTSCWPSWGSTATATPIRAGCREVSGSGWRPGQLPGGASGR